MKTGDLALVFVATLICIGIAPLPVYGGNIPPATGPALYWIDPHHNFSFLHRVYTDGSDKELLMPYPGEGFGIAIDINSGKVYWTDKDNGDIRRGGIEGGGVESPLVSGLSNPTDIDLDVSNAKMYWAEASLAIKRADLDGSNIETLVAPP